VLILAKAMLAMMLGFITSVIFGLILIPLLKKSTQSFPKKETVIIYPLLMMSGRNSVKSSRRSGKKLPKKVCCVMIVL
jgi:UPF0716 family protein affecting phage T7 exclusion